MREPPDQLSLLSQLGHRSCIRCSEEKPATDFAWRDKPKGRRFAHCRACQAKYHRKHYQKHREVYATRIGAARRLTAVENRNRLLSFLRSRSCGDCGESDVIVLEFDHRSDKRFEISQGLRDYTWSAIAAEIEKCEVVCANCHRIRTSKRQGSLRYILTSKTQESRKH